MHRSSACAPISTHTGSIGPDFGDTWSWSGSHIYIHPIEEAKRSRSCAHKMPISWTWACISSCPKPLTLPSPVLTLSSPLCIVFPCVAASDNFGLLQRSCRFQYIHIYLAWIGLNNTHLSWIGLNCSQSPGISEEYDSELWWCVTSNMWFWQGPHSWKQWNHGSPLQGNSHWWNDGCSA